MKKQDFRVSKTRAIISAKRLRPYFMLALTLSASMELSSPAFGQSTHDYSQVTNAKSMAKATSLFNDYLKHFGIRTYVTRCSKVLSAHLGSVEDVYVGACTLTGGHHVTLCADTGIGEFGLSSLYIDQKNSDPDDMERFAKFNCPGG